MTVSHAWFARVPSIWGALLLSSLILLATRIDARAGSAVGAVDGLVADSSLRPIDDAVVQVMFTNVQVRTGASGRFRIVKLPIGSYDLLVRKPGYEAVSSSVEIRADDTTRLSLTMEPASAQLDTMRVRAATVPNRLNDFLARQRVSMGGKFITREQIEKQDPVMTTDLLRRLTGLAVVDSQGVLVAISTRGMKMTPNPKGGMAPVQCVIPVMLDGMRMDATFAINSIPPAEVFGVEVYVGASSIPPEFNATRKDAICGLIAIWTRSGR